MPRFRFEMEPLLRARRQAEQVKQRAVANLERTRLALETRLRSNQEFISEGKRDQRGRLVGVLNLASLRAHAGSTIQVMRQAQRTLLELAGLHRRLEAARAELTEAARERRAIELLRERRFEEWRKRLDRADDAVIDELAVQAAGRGEAAGPPAVRKETSS